MSPETEDESSGALPSRRGGVFIFALFFPRRINSAEREEPFLAQKFGQKTWWAFGSIPPRFVGGRQQ